MAVSETMKRARSALVNIKFPSVAHARAFHYQFKEYEWESDDGSQTLIVQLQHELFDKEMLNTRIRNIVKTTNAITPAVVDSIMGGISV